MPPKKGKGGKDAKGAGEPPPEVHIDPQELAAIEPRQNFTLPRLNSARTIQTQLDRDEERKVREAQKAEEEARKAEEGAVRENEEDEAPKTTVLPVINLNPKSPPSNRPRSAGGSPLKGRAVGPTPEEEEALAMFQEHLQLAEESGGLPKGFGDLEGMVTQDMVDQDEKQAQGMSGMFNTDESRVAEDYDEDEDEVPGMSGEEYEAKLQEEVLRRHVLPGGIISNHRTQTQQKVVLAMNAAKIRIEKCMSEYNAKSRVCKDAKDRADKSDTRARELIKQYNDIGAQLKEEEEHWRLGMDATMKDRLTSQLKTLAGLVKAQKQAAKKEKALYLVALKEQTDAELDLHKLQQTENDLRAYQDERGFENAIICQYRTQQEADAAIRFEKRRQRREREIERLQREEYEATVRVVEAAQECNVKAQANLEATMAALRAEKDAIRERQKQEHDFRVKSLLQLKNSITSVNNELRTANEKAAKRQEHERKEQAKRWGEILENGGNPYEYFRREKEEKRQERERAQLQQRKKDQAVALAASLLVEEERWKKQLEKERFHKEVIRKYQAEVGRSAREKRTTDYIRKVTGGLDVIDPTGKQSRLVPSKVTVTKDWKFGLGKASDKQIDLMQSKYPDVEPMAMHMSMRPVEQYVPRDDSRLADVTNKGPEPEFQKTVKEVYAEPEIKGLWAEDGEEVELIDEENDGRLWRPDYSKLEQDILARARQRQKDNITSKQIVWGKEFKGDAFISKPEVILFKDFEVGQVYTRKITLTNISYTFNTFKLQPLPDYILNFFDIKYKPPGSMSAGLTCDVYIVFSPKVNEDIDDFLPILAQTGPIKIPLKCTTKKTKMEITPPILEIPIVYGEEKEMSIKIDNGGALDSEFELIDPPREEGKEEDAPEAGLDSSVVTFKRDGYVAGYSHTYVSFHFKPVRVGVVEIPLIVRFHQKDTPDIPILVRASACEVPIYLPEETMDFQTCFYGEIYRDILVVNNRSDLPFKIHMEKTRYMHGCLEFNPTLGFVQPKSSFEVQLKFTPNTKLLRQCKEYGDRETGDINVPIRVFVPDQALPVYFCFKAKLTPPQLEFDPPLVDFGDVSTYESCGVELTVRNTAALPQKIGFMKLKRELDVQPNDGFDQLLPGEEGKFTVLFSPSSATDLVGDALCVSGLSHEYKVPVRGRGVTHPIKFSTSVLKLKRTALGDKCSEDITITNTSKSNQTFEFNVPEGSNIALCPLVGTLTPGAHQHLQIIYSPPVPEEEEEEAGEEEGDNQAGEVPPELAGDGEDDENKEEAEEAKDEVKQLTPFYKYICKSNLTQRSESEPWSKHDVVSIPCFIKGAGDMVKYLEIHTTAVEPQLILESNDGLSDLDFGNVPVGQSVTKTVTVRNGGVLTLGLKVAPVDPLGPFVVLNAARSVTSQECHEFYVKFSPTNNLVYRETFKIVSEVNNLVVSLRGTGVAPTFTMEPKPKVLDLGHALPGNTVTQELNFTNTSVFDIAYTVFLEGEGRGNYNGFSPFSVVPVTATVKPGETEKITVSFCPDNESQNFRKNLRVYVPNQFEECNIELRGCCWKSAMYICGGEEVETVDDRFVMPGGAEADKQTAKPIRPRELRVVFPDTAKLPPGHRVEQTLQVGNLMAGGAKGGNGEWIFEELSADAKADGFSVDPPKGAVNSGEKKDVVLSFTRPEKTRLSLVLGNTPQWLQATVKGVLKGGTPAPSNPDGYPFTLHMQAYITEDYDREAVAQDPKAKGGKKGKK